MDTKNLDAANKESNTRKRNKSLLKFRTSDYSKAENDKMKQILKERKEECKNKPKYAIGC